MTNHVNPIDAFIDQCWAGSTERTTNPFAQSLFTRPARKQVRAQQPGPVTNCGTLGVEVTLGVSSALGGTSEQDTGDAEGNPPPADPPGIELAAEPGLNITRGY